jgi:hypothetical protein
MHKTCIKQRIKPTYSNVLCIETAVKVFIELAKAEANKKMVSKGATAYSKLDIERAEKMISNSAFASIVHVAGERETLRPSDTSTGLCLFSLDTVAYWTAAVFGENKK